MPTHAQRLIHAVRGRNHERLRQLIQEHNDISARTTAGRTALHAAAEEGNREAASILIQAGADVNARMQDGQTPLHLAAAYGGYCHLDDLDADRRDPCTRRRHHSISPEVGRILTDLVKEKHPSIPDYLQPEDDIPLEHKGEVFSAMFDCLSEPDQLYREIIARGIDLDRVDPDFSEHLRGNPRFLDVTKLLLDHKADVHAVDKHGASVLRGAVELGKVKMVELLLQRGADPNQETAADASSASLVANTLDFCKVDIAGALLRHGAKFDPNVPGLLDTAAANGRKTVLVWLLDHGADINLRDDSGNTPVLAAAGSGHADVMEVLIGRGADVLARNHEGRGILHAAVSWPACLEHALRLGLPVNEPDCKGRTPLHLAAQSADTSVLQALLRAGADINLRDQAGNTPLHLLFDSDEFRPDIEFPAFLTLVMAGADRSIQNQEPKTTFDRATQWHYPDEYLRLLDPGARIAPGQFLWLGEDAFAGFLPKAMAGFELDGERWPSASHYFHAQKTAGREIRGLIRQAPTVDAAVCRLRDANVKSPANWASRCDGIMRSALLAKFEQNAALREQLLDTGGAILVCDANCEPYYWTERPGTEFNVIGKMLMNIRDEMRATSGKK